MLRWDWNEKVGVMYWKVDNEIYEYQLYQGNALLIEIFEYTDKDGRDMYTLHNFLCDIQHLKNCIKDHLDFSGCRYEFFKDKISDWKPSEFDKLVSGLVKMGAEVVIRVRV